MASLGRKRVWLWLLIALTGVSIAAAGWSSWQTQRLSDEVKAEVESVKGEVAQLRGELDKIKAEQERTKPRVNSEEAAALFVISRGGSVGPKITDPITHVGFGGTDDELKLLAPLTNVTHLALGGDVTDEGLKELALFRGVTTLNLLGAKKITDAGLKELAALPRLDTLELRRVTDQTLFELQQIGYLHTIDRYAQTIDYDRPRGNDNVYRLQLHYPDVTDEGLKTLWVLKNLTVLSLQETRVTDEGLKTLAKLKALRYLSVSNTRVTDAGIAEFRKARPECEISR